MVLPPACCPKDQVSIGPWVRTAIAPFGPGPWRQNQPTFVEAHTQVLAHITCSVVGDEMPSAAKIDAEGMTGARQSDRQSPGRVLLASRGSGTECAFVPHPAHQAY